MNSSTFANKCKGISADSTAIVTLIRGLSRLRARGFFTVATAFAVALVEASAVFGPSAVWEAFLEILGGFWEGERFLAAATIYVDTVAALFNGELEGEP